MTDCLSLMAKTKHCRWRQFSRGTLLVLVMSSLLYTVHWFCYSAIYLELETNLQFGIHCLHTGLWIVLPLTGWIAESWLGRYRAIIMGLLLSVITNLTSQVAFVLLQFNWSQIPAFAFAVTSFVIGTVGFGSLYTNMLPFSLDQMIGASAEDLSAAVQWYYWGFNLSLFLLGILPCVPIPQSIDLPVLLTTLSSLGLVAALLMDWFGHKWLETDHTTGNTIKLIFQVLNYARKNKCPRRRSAFTYLDEEQPSRLDFGKSKFGGPFREEEVEDVKTIFRVLPLLISVFGAFLVFGADDQSNFNATTATLSQILSCLLDEYTMYYAVSFFLIPAYHFILYPLFYKYIPSMLKIIGAGLFLCLVSSLASLSINTIEHLHSNASQCDFGSTATHTSSVPLYWVLIVDLVNGLGVNMVSCTVFEFVMAQTPNRMRGILMGLSIAVIGISILVGVLLTRLFQLFNSATPSCGFYYYLIVSLLILLVLLLFVVLAKRYKLRERERHINIQAIVEEHYERYMDQKEEYMRENKIQNSIKACS